MHHNLLDFWEKYELVTSSKTYISSKYKTKFCRYCEKNEEQTTFIQDTHLLPEFIGRNRILIFDECDACNNLFSGYESHFANFIRPYITLLGIKGKKKVPMFQSRTINNDNSTRTILKHKDANQRELFIQTLDDYKIDTNAQTFEINFRKPSFIPLKVYKSLLKIGLSLLPNEFDKFNKESFEWLINRRSDLSFINYAFISTLKKRYFADPTADLYRAKNLYTNTEEFPEHILILYFANQIIQLFLPFSEEFRKIHSETRELVLNLFPGFAYDKIEGAKQLEIKYYNLGIDTPIKENQKIVFSYQELVNIPQGNK